MKIVMAAFAALLFVSACGKKAPLRPPSSERPPAEEWNPSGEPADEDDDQ
jgi:predicted small lipoprotein YifL